MTVLVLLPRDGLFLKDGREWASAAAGRAHSLGWPAPSTLLGALCTATGRMQETAGKSVLTPSQWKALHGQMQLAATLPVRRMVGGAGGWAASDRVWPVPADAMFLPDPNRLGSRIRRLDPMPMPPVVQMLEPDPAIEALWRPQPDESGKPGRSPEWWPEAAFVEWLIARDDVRQWSGPFVGLGLPRHTQVHVGIKPATQTAEDAVLFAHDVVETIDKDRREWGIACRFTAPGKPLTGHVTIGGDRRLAAVENASDALFAAPDAIVQAFRATRPRGLRLIAVTPAAFGGWLPPDFSANGNEFHGTVQGVAGTLVLRAACIGRAAHVSGWDMEKGAPKSTTRLVPPGSVFFLEKAGGGRFTAEEAEQLWLAPLGTRINEGFGRFVPGIWHSKELGQ